MRDKVNLEAKFGRFKELWTPKIVGEVDDYHVKLVKLKGEFEWHTHKEADEFFLSVKGAFDVRLRDRTVHLDEGEFFVVPRGVEHCPFAALEAHVLLLERKSTVNTGEVRSERTVTPKWIQWSRLEYGARPQTTRTASPHRRPRPVSAQ